MSWKPLEQDWPEEATVKVRHDIRRVVDSVEPLPELPRPVSARQHILSQAALHITRALDELEEAVAWFSIVDPKDQGETIRRVEALRDTIEYRASL